MADTSGNRVPIFVTTIDCRVVRPAGVPDNGVTGIGYAVEDDKVALVLRHPDGETLVGILNDEMLQFLCNNIAGAMKAARALRRPTIPTATQP